jgi:hypothetical protein
MQSPGVVKLDTAFSIASTTSSPLTFNANEILVPDFSSRAIKIVAVECEIAAQTLTSTPVGPNTYQLQVNSANVGPKLSPATLATGAEPARMRVVMPASEPARQFAANDVICTLTWFTNQQALGKMRVFYRLEGDTVFSSITK